MCGRPRIGRCGRQGVGGDDDAFARFCHHSQVQHGVVCVFYPHLFAIGAISLHIV